MWVQVPPSPPNGDIVQWFRIIGSNPIDVGSNPTVPAKLHGIIVRVVKGI